MEADPRSSFIIPQAASLKKNAFHNTEIEYSNVRYMFGNFDLSGAKSSFVKGSSFAGPNRSSPYKTVATRWFILFQFAMSLASTTFNMMCFASISSIVAAIYEVDSLVVNFNVMVYLFAFVLFNFVSISAIEFSMRWTFQLCAAFNIVFSWGKWFVLYATDDFYYLVVLQTVMACTQPFLGNGASKVATVWFADDERALATAIGSLSNPLGCIIGLVLGPIYVPEIDKNEENENAGKEAVQHYMMVAAILITLMNICTVIAFQEKPDQFPSESAETSVSVKFSMRQDAKELLKNRNYLILMSCFSLMYGVYACLGAIINNLVEPFGFNSTHAGIFGGAFIIFGLVGSFAFSASLDKRGDYIKSLRMVTFGTLGLMLLLIGTLNIGNTVLVTINIAALGAFVLPIIPVGYSFAVRASQPVSEVMSTGSMMLVGQLAGVIITLIASMMSQYSGKNVPILFSCFIAISAVLSLFITDEVADIHQNKQEEIIKDDPYAESTSSQKQEEKMDKEQQQYFTD